MRALLDHLLAHLRDDWRPGYYAATAASLAILLGLAVAFDVEAEYIDAYFLHPLQIPLYALFYGLPWALAVALHATFHGKTALLREPRMWRAGLFALLIFAVYANFHYYAPWIAANIDPRGRAFVFHCAANLARAGLGFALVVAFWRCFDRDRPLYGLRRGGFELRPYLWILLPLAAAVSWASTRPDFLATYPRHDPGPEMELWNLSRAEVWTIFEFCYGADFIFTELFFRGLLVLGMARWLGPGAVMPMTVWYAFIHVSKPLGELIGSIFGGWALGVLALRTRSILGGVVLHLGLAYMMELAAILRKTALAP